MIIMRIFLRRCKDDEVSRLLFTSAGVGDGDGGVISARQTRHKAIGVSELGYLEVPS